MIWSTRSQRSGWLVRIVSGTVLAGALVCAGAMNAEAQVCGDADGSGTVTVTDSVQVLRAAAGLSTVCTLSLCDVDGNGTVTTTDGVNTLRKAVSLPVAENCTFGPVLP